MLIKGDRDQLGQVIVNLVLNAVDAMDHEGTMTLRTYRNKPAQKACIEVSDTGRGIPAKDLALIFDPFFYHQSTGKRYWAWLEHLLWNNQRKQWTYLGKGNEQERNNFSGGTPSLSAFRP